MNNYTEKTKNTTNILRPPYVLADKVSKIFESKSVSEEIKSILDHLICQEAYEMDLGLTHPEIVKIALPLLLESLQEQSLDAHRMFYSAIEAIVGRVRSEMYEFDEVLDLSNQPKNFSISAQYVENLINRDDLPKDVQSVLHHWCANHAEGNHD